MKVDMQQFLNADKNATMESDMFVGTAIQSLGELKGYTVNMLFVGYSIPSRVVQTSEEARGLEAKAWEVLKGEKANG